MQHKRQFLVLIILRRDCLVPRNDVMVYISYFLFCSMVFKQGGCVYIITNKLNTVLYTGVTSDLIDRIWDHKNKVYPDSFTSKCNCDKLVYFLFHSHIEEAIADEKRIKGSSRAYKKQLIHDLNPEWKDLYPELIK